MSCQAEEHVAPLKPFQSYAKLQINVSMMSLTRALSTLRGGKVVVMFINTVLPQISVIKLLLYDLCPATGQTWLTSLNKVRTNISFLKRGRREPPSHQTLNRTTSLPPLLCFHTRSSHAGYASAISMQPVAWAVWRQTDIHIHTDTSSCRSALLMRCQSVPVPVGLLVEETKREKERKPSWGVCTISWVAEENTVVHADGQAKAGNWF